MIQIKKIHIEYIHCLKFETKLLLIANTIEEKTKKTQSSFTRWSMEGNGEGLYAYELIPLYARILRMVHVLIICVKASQLDALCHGYIGLLHWIQTKLS